MPGRALAGLPDMESEGESEESEERRYVIDDKIGTPV
jgi:hypothetical protein